jgi:hypothetical protein
MKAVYFFSCLLFLSCSFYIGCGGADSDSEASLKTIAGIAADGALAESDVGVDANENGSLDDSEVLTSTRLDGTYSFEIDKSASGNVLVNGGKDQAFGTPFRGTLKSQLPQSSVTNLMITPLTTLLAEGMPESRVKNFFNIGPAIDFLHDNPLESFELRKAGAKLQAVATLMQTSSSQNLELVYEKIASLSESTFQTAAFEEAFSSLNFSDFSTAVEDINSSLKALDSVTNDAALTLTMAGLLPGGFQTADVLGKGFDYILEERVAFILFRPDGTAIQTREIENPTTNGSPVGYSGSWSIKEDGSLDFASNNLYVPVSGLLSFSNVASFPTTFTLNAIGSNYFKADLTISEPGNEITSTNVRFTLSEKCPSNSYPVFDGSGNVSSCSSAALQ